MEFKAAVLVSTLLCLALSQGALCQRAPIVETPAPAPAPGYVDLADLLSLAGPYRTFLDYLTRTDVIKTFQSQANDTKQGISVFAPLDSAFAAVDSGALSNLTAGQLRSLMLHHAMPKYYPLSAFSKLAAASPVPMFAYKVKVTDDAGIIGVVSGWATEKLVSSVYSTSPVAVYALDSVLLPKGSPEMGRLELIKKRKADEDDEIIFLIFPALYFHLMGSREKTKRHSSILYGKKRVRGLLNGHIKNCRTAFRMEPQIFRWLASYLRNEGLILDSRLKVEEKLAFFLYMLSHNASFEDLQVEFEHSGSTFHTYIKEFFNIIPTLATRFNCIGTIDGSHVPVSLTFESQAPWRNRKGSLSQNVMFACDFDMNVTFISCGWEGSVTDARVLSSAMLKGFQVPPSKFYLVDGGYANTKFFLAPYRGVRYHLKEWEHGRRRPQNHRELFNLRHAIMRNHVERILGILKKRFHILNVASFHQLENQVKIPAAAAIIHNIIKMHDGDEEWLDNEEEDNIDPRTYVNLPNDGDNLQENNFLENSIQGNNLRDQIAWQMWLDYQQQQE
ncbi:hypothetical protein ACQ4PT_021038 [Festuca glaucescens]